MTANPVEQIGGITTSGNVPKADFVSWEKARVIEVMASVSEVRNTTLIGQSAIFLRSFNAIFLYDSADTTTADDGGVTCVISADGGRFKPFPLVANTNDLTRAAAINAMIPSTVNSIRTTGYAIPGDGGGALHKRVSSLPTLAFGFQSADGAWWQYAEIAMNVLAFGADPTGVVNSQGAINAAIDMACRMAGATKGIVLIPPGTYLVNGGVNATQLIAGCTFQGGGLNNTILMATTTTNVVFDMTGSAAVTVRDLQISGAQSASANYAILLAASMTDSSDVNFFINVSVTGWWSQACVLIYHSSDGGWENCQLSNFNPACFVVMYITASNSFGASSSFADITNVALGQSGDWVFKSFEIHDLSTFATGFSTCIPLYIQGDFSPVKFVGGVISGCVTSASGAHVIFDGTSVGGVSFIGSQFYADNGNQSHYAFLLRTNVTGLVIKGCGILYGVALIAFDNGKTLAGADITGNKTFGGPASLVSPHSGNGTLTGSFIDAQNGVINLGVSGVLSHNVITRVGGITAGTQTSNGLF